MIRSRVRWCVRRRGRRFPPGKIIQTVWRARPGAPVARIEAIDVGENTAPRSLPTAELVELNGDLTQGQRRPYRFITWPLGFLHQLRVDVDRALAATGFAALCPLAIARCLELAHRAFSN
jgi:hypothetical protein